MSYKFTIRLTPRDEEKINSLKERYGYTQTSELIRFLLTSQYEQMRSEDRGQSRQFA